MKLRLLLTYLLCAIFGLIQAQNCELGDLLLQPHDCDEDSYLLDVDLSSYNNTSDNFLLYLNGDYLGTFGYDELSITVGPIEGDGEAVSVVLYDQLDSACIVFADYIAPDCIQECEIVAELISTECWGDTLLVSFDVMCDYSSGEFELTGNGENYGIFSCNQQNVSIYAWTEGLDELEFIFTDIEDSECKEEIVFDNPCAVSEECEFGLNVIQSECYGDSIVLTFEVECPDGVEEYVVSENGVDLGVYDCEAGEITVLTVSEDNNLELTFSELDTDDCETSIVLANPCVETQCHIDSLIAEAHACDSTGTFLVDIYFDYSGVSDSFLLEINGTSYGCFAFSDLFITVGPFTPNTPELEILVQEKEDQECFATTVIQAPECFGGPCVEELKMEIEVTECTGETYLMHVDVIHLGDAVNFELAIGDAHQGVFNSEEFPVILGSFLGQGEEEFIQLRQVGGNQCAWSEEYIEPQCLTSVSRLENKRFSWHILPNGIVLSKAAESLERTVIISNLSGQVLQSSTWQSHLESHMISNEELNTGMYIVYVEGYRSEKIVIMK